LGTNATLFLAGGTLSNSSAGIIMAAGSGAQLYLEGASVSGGTLKTSAGGEVVILYDTVLSGVANDGVVSVFGTLELAGSNIRRAQRGVP
jgi:hypothetical protein